MASSMSFARCVNCFAPKQEPGSCTHCGYESGLCAPPCRWLMPGTILKGRYVVGRQRSSNEEQIQYLAWDLQREQTVELVEYFPRELATRDITLSEAVVCIPGKEALLEMGKQQFFERAKIYFQCVSSLQDLVMDFFVRNNTCYYVR